MAVSEKTTGEKIKQARLNAHMTQKQLAEKCGMADSAIRKYESGKVTPKVETAKKIAAALDISWKTLYPTFEETIPVIKDRILSGEATLDNVTQTLQSKTYIMPESEEELIKFFRELNDIGKEVAKQRLSELTQIPAYQEKQTIAPDTAGAAADDTKDVAPDKK